MTNILKLKIIGTILLSIILSIMVNISRPKKDNSDLLHDWFWVNKTHFSKKGSILFLGDSRIYRGITTAPIKKIFPDQEIINLGYSSGGLNSKVFEFALNHFDLSKQTKIIVLGISPFALTSETRKNEHLNQELNRPLAEIIERKYANPFLTEFETIKLTDYKTQKNITSYYQTFHNDGWVESYKVPFNNEEALSSYQTILHETELNELSIKEIFDFTEKMKAIGVKVYGFRPPSTKKMELLENELLKFDENKFIASFENKGGLWIKIPNRYSFNSYDGSHLHYKSAIQLSEYLATKLNQ